MYAKKRKTSLLFYLLLIILLATFFTSGYYVFTYIQDSQSQESLYDDLAAIVEGNMSEGSFRDLPDTQDFEGGDGAEDGAMIRGYEKLYNRNNHMVGWIKIEETKINYPVMQTPEEKDYYLRRNFDRQSSSHGCIYVREECDVNEPSDNVTIYGHRMKDGSMFADLEKYMKEEFWVEHPTIRFDTLTEMHTYEIFAVFRTSASLNHGFQYHNFIDAAIEEDFDQFVASCKELALYDTGITPEYGDKIICLSTCEYSQPNGRLVVAAVRTK